MTNVTGTRHTTRWQRWRSDGRRTCTRTTRRWRNYCAWSVTTRRSRNSSRSRATSAANTNRRRLVGYSSDVGFCCTTHVSCYTGPIVGIESSSQLFFFFCISLSTQFVVAMLWSVVRLRVVVYVVGTCLCDKLELSVLDLATRDSRPAICAHVPQT